MTFLVLVHYIMVRADFDFSDFSYRFSNRDSYLKAESYIKANANDYSAGTMRGGGFWCIGDFKEGSIFIKFEGGTK